MCISCQIFRFGPGAVRSASLVDGICQGAQHTHWSMFLRTVMPEQLLTCRSLESHMWTMLENANTASVGTQGAQVPSRLRQLCWSMASVKERSKPMLRFFRSKYSHVALGRITPEQCCLQVWSRYYVGVGIGYGTEALILGLMNIYLCYGPSLNWSLECWKQCLLKLGRRVDQGCSMHRPKAVTL